MKTLKTPLVLASTLIVVTLFVSWKLQDDDATSATPSALLHKDILKNAETSSFITGDELSSSTNQFPVVEDVLVQRIPGDNGHLLLMAYYSKENRSEESITIENGFSITLRDDGKDNDKIAGDGLYTATIPADIAAFRSQAVGMVQKMKRATYMPVRYLDRQRIIDPDVPESFDMARFDANQPVSVSGLTNALSEDVAPAATNLTTLDSIRRNSVLITNLAVVEDPNRTWNYCTQKGNASGPWTFGTLMRQLATKIPLLPATDAQVSDFVKKWLSSWASSQTINGDVVAARTKVNTVILNPWLTKSRNAGAPAGQLDMRFAPFKLMAIVNRFDLRNVGPLFGVFGTPCGESRFVFCLMKDDCSGPLQMTVIFEYGINKSGLCLSQHDWAQQWVNLKNFPIGSTSYNQALQKITDQFTKCGTNVLKPNQSSLDQLRTNEIALASASPLRWEFREFTLDNTTGNLKETTVKQTVSDKFNAQVVNTNVQHMVAFVNAKQGSIKSGKDTVPSTWQGVQFLGGTSRVNGNPTGNPPGVYHWDGTGAGNTSTFIKDNDARFNFSLQACSGCHAGETQTAFTQINPAPFGKVAGLSGFLTGIKGTGGAIDFDHDSANLLMSVRDAALRPSTNPAIRTFNDIDRRARDLRSFVSTTCGTIFSISSQLMFQPVTTVH
jgi:hypothetical protein